jgi:hypothetical protein
MHNLHMASQDDCNGDPDIFALLIPITEQTDAIASWYNSGIYKPRSSAHAPVSRESTPLPFAPLGWLELRLSNTETGSWTLGRDEACDIVLSGAGVSRQHCTIAYDQYGIIILKDSSSYGTSVHYDYGHPKLLLKSVDKITWADIRKMHESIQVSIGSLSFSLQLNYEHINKPKIDKTYQSRQQALPKMGMLRVDSVTTTKAPGTPQELTNFGDFGDSVYYDVTQFWAGTNDHHTTTWSGHISDPYDPPAPDGLPVQLNETRHEPSNTNYATGTTTGSRGDDFSESEDDCPDCPQGRDSNIDSSLTDCRAVEPIPTPAMINIPRVEYVCPEHDKPGISEDPCGKTFPSLRGLKHHLETMHNEYRHYRCKVERCGKRFTVEYDLKRHYETHLLKPNGRSIKMDIARLKDILGPEYEELARQLEITSAKSTATNSHSKDSRTRPRGISRLSSTTINSQATKPIPATVRPQKDRNACRVRGCVFGTSHMSNLRMHYARHLPSPPGIIRKKKLEVVSEKDMKTILDSDNIPFQSVKDQWNRRANHEK